MKELNKYKSLASIAWATMMLGWLIVPLAPWLGMGIVGVSIMVGIMMELKYRCPNCHDLLDSEEEINSDCPNCGKSLV